MVMIMMAEIGFFRNLQSSSNLFEKNNIDDDDDDDMTAIEFSHNLTISIAKLQLIQKQDYTTYNQQH